MLGGQQGEGREGPYISRKEYVTLSYRGNQEERAHLVSGVPSICNFTTGSALNVPECGTLRSVNFVAEGWG